jgi:hypothetical protein
VIWVGLGSFGTENSSTSEASKKTGLYRHFLQSVCEIRHSEAQFEGGKVQKQRSVRIRQENDGLKSKIASLKAKNSRSKFLNRMIEQMYERAMDTIELHTKSQQNDQ